MIKQKLTMIYYESMTPARKENKLELSTIMSHRSKSYKHDRYVKCEHRNYILVEMNLHRHIIKVIDPPFYQHQRHKVLLWIKFALQVH